MKIIAGSIDLSKIDKTRIVTLDKDGNPFKNGAKYLNIDIIVNDEKNQYGQDCSISQAQTKEERERKDKKNYLGNGKTVWEGATKAKESNQETPKQSDDLPF